MHTRPLIPAALAAALVATAGLALPAVAAIPQSSLTTFEGGVTNGWEGYHNPPFGWTEINETDGNPGASLHTVFENFWIEFYNTSSGLVGDYTHAPFTVSIDVKINSMDFWGTPVSRDLILELRDYNAPGSDYPWTGVWYNLGTIGTSDAWGGFDGWRTFTVTVDDPTSLTLPAGWGGTGDENEFAEPQLPADRTFASVLASVDEIAFLTLQPGFVSGFVNYDMQVDNISISFIPEPGSLALLGLTGLTLLRRRR